MNIFNIITCNSLIIYTKIINITSKSSSFDIIYWLVFWDAFKAYWAYYNFRIFCFKLVNFCIINKQISICPIVMQAKTIFFFVTVKLIEIFSAISICSSPCVGPIPRTYIFFFLLSIWTEELISTPKINIFLPNPPLGNEKLPLLSNPVP